MEGTQKQSDQRTSKFSRTGLAWGGAYGGRKRGACEKEVVEESARGSENIGMYYGQNTPEIPDEKEYHWERVNPQRVENLEQERTQKGTAN